MRGRKREGKWDGGRSKGKESYKQVELGRGERVLKLTGIHLVHADMTYYIDPNEGSNGDAIGVTCRRFETIEGWFTCLSPEKSQIVSVSGS